VVTLRVSNAKVDSPIPPKLLFTVSELRQQLAKRPGMTWKVVEHENAQYFIAERYDLVNKVMEWKNDSGSDVVSDNGDTLSVLYTKVVMTVSDIQSTPTVGTNHVHPVLSMWRQQKGILVVLHQQRILKERSFFSTGIESRMSIPMIRGFKRLVYRTTIAAVDQFLQHVYQTSFCKQEDGARAPTSYYGARAILYFTMGPQVGGNGD
jgi:hypothetical protein